MRIKGIIEFTLMLGLLTGAASVLQTADAAIPAGAAIGQTPPRLSFTDGQASFWRPGAQDWTSAEINTPLAPGDELYTASPGNLEIQIGARAFVRTWANTQLGLTSHEPDFLQFKLTAGHAAVDLRSIEAGHTVEVDTPNAAFTIEHPGYYRVNVTGERTSFITRRGGRATLTPAGGQPVAVDPSEEVVVDGASSAQIASYAAPPLDVWDRWNYGRSDTLLDAISARYVSPGTYGASDLDPYGTWRAVPTYGSVWVPTAVPSGWVPYSTGTWMLDPYYGWTWVDTAPWGWAPYHYGRWVFVDGFWAWAPGPIVARPVYAPALVAFFGEPGVRVGVSFSGSVVGWVALGWGEPVVPWWGRDREPSWRGWGGPRIVNNTVVNNTTVVNVRNINVYRNAGVQNAVVAIDRHRFGRGPIGPAREMRLDAKTLRPTHAVPPVSVTPASFVPATSRGVQPPETAVKRSVVATRPWHISPVPAGGAARGPAAAAAAAPRVVSAPQRAGAVEVTARPPLVQGGLERPGADRNLPPPPRALETRAAATQPGREAQAANRRPAAPVDRAPAPEHRAAPPRVFSPAAPLPMAGRAEAPRARAPESAGAPMPRPLPGKPANRLAPQRGERPASREIER